VASRSAPTTATVAPSISAKALVAISAVSAITAVPTIGPVAAVVAIAMMLIRLMLLGLGGCRRRSARVGSIGEAWAFRSTVAIPAAGTAAAVVGRRCRWRYGSRRWRGRGSCFDDRRALDPVANLGAFRRLGGRFPCCGGAFAAVGSLTAWGAFASW